MCDHVSIQRNLLAAIKGGRLDDDDFNSLAVSVFGYQFEHNTPYRQLCQTQHIHPDMLTQWQEIPAVPTDVFKLMDHPMVTFPLEKTKKTFLTSGTTTEINGRHHFPSLSLYDQSITGAWQELELPEARHAVILTPSPDKAPHSSLSHMMGVLANTYAKKPTWALDDTGQLDIHAISRAASGDHPIALLGTALAFLHLFEMLDSPLALPTGSWAMETGGYKGTNRQMEKKDLYRLFEQYLHLAPDSIINEYSMTELSSQFYTRGLNHPHVGPSWTRVRVINPFTNTDSLPGEPGHLVIYDLANLYSTMAIRTQDLAVLSEADLAGENNSFTLLGRDPSALPRGCSRAADQSLSS